jgi:hypothetical protein
VKSFLLTLVIACVTMCSTAMAWNYEGSIPDSRATKVGHPYSSMIRSDGRHHAAYRPHRRGAATGQRRSHSGFTQRVGYHLGLSASCASAARQGGPCGCVVAERLGLARNFRGHNLWLANDWLRFPRTVPHVGAVAVWPGRHVEIVTAVNGGTVSTSGSVGFHSVPVSRLVFVDPR